MYTDVEIGVPVVVADDPSAVNRLLKEAAGLESESNQATIEIVHRSLDARQRIPIIRIRARVYRGDVPASGQPVTTGLKDADPRRRVIIVGAGPAGYFAALECLRYGITPVVVERGKDVRDRRRDLRAIQQEGKVNPNSNYCFGEGGAGTYSDGKLYTRSKKRGDVHRVLQLLVEHGAHPDILIDAHPHIGSNKLWLVVLSVRETIERYGGFIRFNSKVNNFIITSERIRGVELDSGEEIVGDAVVLATGHSARDIYTLCAERNIHIEPKPFALGVRIEHPQSLIDKIQYRLGNGDEVAHKRGSSLLHRHHSLPAASYSATCQIENRGVFSFCMCPGGLIVPSATSSDEIVVNGMSMSRRDSAYANSGMVVSVEHEDWNHFTPGLGALAAMQFQARVEQAAYSSARSGNDSKNLQQAPAQRLTDFLANKISSDLPPASYIPGLVPRDLREILPASIYHRLNLGLREFGRKMKGYITSDAVLVGVESRTSAPVRIPRDRESFEHVGVKGLYPCGEGAGYAGGIVSAAIDGMNVAHAIAVRIFRAA